MKYNEHFLLSVVSLKEILGTHSVLVTHKVMVVSINMIKEILGAHSVLVTHKVMSVPIKQILGTHSFAGST